MRQTRSRALAVLAPAAFACLVVAVAVGTGSSPTDRPLERVAVDQAPTAPPAEPVKFVPPATTPPPVEAAPSTTTSAPPPSDVPVTAEESTFEEPAPEPPPLSAQEQIDAAFAAAVPARWRSLITVELVPVGGSTSLAYPGGRIDVAEYHRTRGETLLRSVIAHEFGHLIAFRYGSQEFNGAAPVGWHYEGRSPEEMWADCVSLSFTGNVDRSYNLPACAGETLSWTQNYLSTGP